jgi:hypothetical protein
MSIGYILWTNTVDTVGDICCDVATFIAISSLSLVMHVVRFSGSVVRTVSDLQDKQNRGSRGESTRRVERVLEGKS